MGVYFTVPLIHHKKKKMIEGFLVIDKPEGITSADVVRVVKRVLRVKKVGYIGTLDPIATGVLPVGMGRATRLFPFLEKQDKTYDAVMTLGVETDTQDKTGAHLATADPSGVTEEMVKEAMAGFTGDIMQVPPMYSAKKIDGERLYGLARRGITVEREPNPARVSELRFISKNGPNVRFITTVSTGCYVRTLCHDIGEKLGVHAHLSALIRVKAGHFTIEESIPLSRIEEGGIDAAKEKLLSLSNGLGNLSRAVIISHAHDRVRNGMPIGVSDIVKYDDIPGAPFVRVEDKAGDLICVGVKKGAPLAGFPFTNIQPKKVLF